MTDLRQAAQQALEALDDEHYVSKYTHIVEAITALREALEQPEQEPVAYLWQHCETGRTRIVMPDDVITADATWFVVGPLFIHPAKQVPMTNDQIYELYSEPRSDAEMVEFARAIEKHHGIGK